MCSAETGGDPPLALVDLGDTLAECTPALRAGLAHLRRPGEREADEMLEPLPPHLEQRRRAVLAEPGFWRALAPRAQGFELLALLRGAGFRVHVLTKGPRGAPQVWADKVAWCREHLPDVPVTVTDDKSCVHGAVLVDDWLPYVQGWLRQWPGGLAIVPMQPWNEQLPPGLPCLHYDGCNGEALRVELRRLIAARRSG